MNAPLRPIAGFALLSACALGLCGCAFPGPESKADRETLQSCRAEANRVYDVQNRYQLSERDMHDTPFSGSGQPTTPSDGLADQYSHEVRVEDCVRHGDATAETAPPPTTAPAAAPASGAADTP